MRIRKGYFGSVEKSFDGKHVRKGYFGPVEYTFDGKHFRKGYFGKVEYTVDGKHLRKGYFGPVKYTLDGNHIRKGYFGSVVGTIDGKSKKPVQPVTRGNATSSYRSRYRNTKPMVYTKRRPGYNMDAKTKATLSKMALGFTIMFLLLGVYAGLGGNSTDDAKRNRVSNTGQTQSIRTEPSDTDSCESVTRTDNNKTTQPTATGFYCSYSGCTNVIPPRMKYCETHKVSNRSSSTTKGSLTTSGYRFGSSGTTSYTRSYSNNNESSFNIDEAYEEEIDDIFWSDSELYGDIDAVYDDFDWIE